MKRVVVGCVLVCAGICVGCNEKESPPPAASATSVATPLASASATPPSASASKLVVLVSAKGDVLGAGANGEGLFAGTKTGIAITSGKLSEMPELAKGLEHPRWSELQVVGNDASVVAFAGKRDPKALQLGDKMMYMEDTSIGADRTVFRSFQKGGWVRVSSVNEGEKLGGFGRFQDRIVAAIEMSGGKDYRFALVAGKPGIALPAPSPADKPKEPEPAAEPTAEPAAAGAAGAPATPAASGGSGPPPTPPTASAPPAEEKPLDPNVPHPDLASECQTRLVPRAFDGLSSGEAILVGRVCPGAGDYWVEHWAPKKRKASFEKISSPPNENLVVKMTTEGRAVIAALGTSWAIERTSSGEWKKLALPAGDVTQLTVAPNGRLWLVISGKVFHRTGDAAFVELALPSGKQATSVLASDGDEPFVIAGSELLGPASAFTGQVVALEGAATDLCKQPYVIVESNIKRTKKYPEAVAKVEKAKVAASALVFGHRGMAGIDSIQAKLSDMKAARELSKALGGAEIVCGPPRTEAPVPEAK